MVKNRLAKHFDCLPAWQGDTEQQEVLSSYHPQADDLMSPFEEPGISGSSKSLWSVVEQLRQSEVDRLEGRIESLEHAAISFRGVIYPIDSILPGVLLVKKTIHAQVVYEDDCYIACFSDANINASGESEIDAVAMLRDSIATTFLAFTENEDRLGPGPLRQLSVLREFVGGATKWQGVSSLIKLLRRPLKSLKLRT